MKARRFIIGLITFSIIVTVILFQLFKYFNLQYLSVKEDSTFNVEVTKNFTMSGSIYVNGEYSLPLAYSANGECLCENLRKGDMLYKIKNEKVFYRVRNLDTLIFEPDWEG